MKRNKYLILFLLLSLNLSYAQGQMKIYNRFMPVDLSRDSNFMEYFNHFKIIVSKDDSLGMAKLLDANFPLNVRLDKIGSRTNETTLFKVNNQKQFLKLYPRIFDARMKKLIARQQLKDLSLMERGIMLSHGEIWWYYYKDSKKIIISTMANVGYLFSKDMIKK